MRYFLILLLLCCGSVWATNSSLNLSVPSPSTTYQSDRFRAGELDCQNAIGGGTNFEVGVTGIISEETDPLSINYGQRRNDVGVYARIIIPLDAPPERINCNTLYQLELQKKRYEVERLEQEIQNLRNLKFENTK